MLGSVILSFGMNILDPGNSVMSGTFLALNYSPFLTANGYMMAVLNERWLTLPREVGGQSYRRGLWRQELPVASVIVDRFRTILVIQSWFQHRLEVE